MNCQILKVIRVSTLLPFGKRRLIARREYDGIFP